MNHMPNIVVNSFDGTLVDFMDKFSRYYETNANYRGYSEMLDLIASKDLTTYELFEVVSDNEPSGVAAVKLVGQTIFFDVFVIDEGFRGIGVGDLLFEEIVNNPKFKHATHYESMALPGDRSTKNFFEQRNGKARLLIVGGPLKKSPMKP